MFQHLFPFLSHRNTAIKYYPGKLLKNLVRCHWKTHYSVGLTMCPHTGTPHFLKGHFTPLCFYKDLHWYLFSLTERNPKAIFDFTIKSKNSVQRLTCGWRSQTQRTPEHVARRALSPEPHSASQHPAPAARNCL